MPTFTKSPRVKRFQRTSASERTPLRLTERDLALVRAVAHFRFLSSSQLIPLAGGSNQQIVRRLRLLFDNGFLDRPRAQIAQFFSDGNRPTVYGLGRNGANIISQQDGIDLHRLDWTTKNNRAGSEFIAHTIETAQVMLCFAAACTNNSVRLLDHHDLLPLMPAKTRSEHNPFSWRAEVQDRGKRISIGLVPDRLFSLAFPDNMRLNFALEIDRGTMPVKRHSLKGTSIRKKLLAYLEGWKVGRQEHWGFKRFRVLMLTTSSERIRTMLTALAEITGGKGSDLFLFTTVSDITSSDPFTLAWMSGKGQSVRLLG